jgi:pyruvate dehydrogenase E2 component (dihydrolipoamide acetyltransferase)
MPTIVKMPKLGLTMTEGTIIKWYVNEGDRIEKGVPLLEIQTDKVNMEEESPASGIVAKIVEPEGSNVAVTKPIAVIIREDEEIPNIEDIIGETEGDIGRQDSGTDKSQEDIESNSREIEGATDKDKKPLEKIKATPAARRLARERDIDLSLVTPSGPDGRILEKDVRNFINNRKMRVSPLAEKIAGAKGIDLSKIDKPRDERIMKDDLERAYTGEIIPIKGMRKVIAQKMVLSKNIAPHYYVSINVDMTEIVRLKSQMAELGLETPPSYTDILIKVTATALKKHPIINSTISDDKIIINERINVGLAVSLDEGLIVPVIKDADKKTISEIALESKQLVDRAKTGKLLPDEYTGGTFTISNLGMFGVDNFTAIINQPENAILAVGRIVKKPVVVNDQICIRSIVNLTLSSDHRAIDGAEAARFLGTIKNILENPILLLC